MTGLVETSATKYAVIEARWAENPSERFVVTYANEEVLRDLIAEPSIIACGYESREEAEADIESRFCTSVGSRVQ